MNVFTSSATCGDRPVTIAEVSSSSRGVQPMIIGRQPSETWMGYNFTVTTGMHRTDVVIKVRCTAGHTVTSAPAGVRVTHSGGIVVGHEVWCAECCAYDAAEAAPEKLAMLLEMGVELALLPLPEDHALPIVSDYRRLVSLRYMISDEALSQLSDASDSQDVV